MPSSRRSSREETKPSHSRAKAAISGGELWGSLQRFGQQPCRRLRRQGYRRNGGGGGSRTRVFRAVRRTSPSAFDGKRFGREGHRHPLALPSCDVDVRSCLVAKHDREPSCDDARFQPDGRTSIERATQLIKQPMPIHRRHLLVVSGVFTSTRALGSLPLRQVPESIPGTPKECICGLYGSASEGLEKARLWAGGSTAAVG